MAAGCANGLIAQYEELRSYALSNAAGLRQNLGYALFLRQGMVAWARAWRSYATEPPTPAPAAVEAGNPVPLDLRGQVALVLAGIIFSLQRQEVCRC